MSFCFHKIRNCFLGLAVGDALGVPYEFKNRSYFIDHPAKGMTGYGTWNQPPGTWSDDSSMTFCLAESLIHGYHPSDIGAKFLAWYTRGYWGAHHKVFDIGSTTRFSLARIKDGEDPLFAGEWGEESNGNGSLMRIAPASLYFADEGDNILFEKIKEISGITHGHFRSVFSCFIYSCILIELFLGNEKLVAFQNARQRLNSFIKKNDFNPKEIRLFSRILSGSIADVKSEDVQSSGYVLHTLEASIWAFLNTSTFEEAVLSVVNLGGDTDTTGCITGALAGLLYPEDCIPPTWLETVARREDIIRLADNFRDAIKNKLLRDGSTIHS